MSNLVENCEAPTWSAPEGAPHAGLSKLCPQQQIVLIWGAFIKNVKPCM